MPKVRHSDLHAYEKGSAYCKESTVKKVSTNKEKKSLHKSDIIATDVVDSNTEKLSPKEALLHKIMLNSRKFTSQRDTSDDLPSLRFQQTRQEALDKVDSTLLNKESTRESSNVFIESDVESNPEILKKKVQTEKYNNVIIHEEISTCKNQPDNLFADGNVISDNALLAKNTKELVVPAKQLTSNKVEGNNLNKKSKADLLNNQRILSHKERLRNLGKFFNTGNMRGDRIKSEINKILSSSGSTSLTPTSITTISGILQGQLQKQKGSMQDSPISVRWCRNLKPTEQVKKVSAINSLKKYSHKDSSNSDSDLDLNANKKKTLTANAMHVMKENYKRILTHNTRMDILKNYAGKRKRRKPRRKKRYLSTSDTTSDSDKNNRHKIRTSSRSDTTSNSNNKNRHTVHTSDTTSDSDTNDKPTVHTSDTTSDSNKNYKYRVRTSSRSDTTFNSNNKDRHRICTSNTTSDSNKNYRHKVRTSSRSDTTSNSNNKDRHTVCTCKTTSDSKNNKDTVRTSGSTSLSRTSVTPISDQLQKQKSSMQDSLISIRCNRNLKLTEQVKKVSAINFATTLSLNKSSHRVSSNSDSELDLNANKKKTLTANANGEVNLFLSKVDYNYEDQKQEVLNKEESIKSLIKRPRYLGMYHYLAKENVVLLISKFKETFIELIQTNNCVIVKGETGCGKSSRVPQYVLEAWVRDVTSEGQLCRIAVTQPSRIAAISLAERVASERDEQLGHIVGFQVHLKSSFQSHTGRILYCTTGILLGYLESDPNLTQFSHVILDEAHELDVNTDPLMTKVKKALEQNKNLKVVVMSATIDADEFSVYFNGAPKFYVPGFSYPVPKNYLYNSKLEV